MPDGGVETSRLRRRLRTAGGAADVGAVSVPPTTDDMVASLADQLCVIVDDNYDFRVSVPSSDGNLQIQKLTVLINALLENVRRNIGGLSDLAQRLEEKVHERTLRLDLVVQGANDGVWLWDLGRNSVEYSARWRQLMGLEDERLGSIEDWLSRVHPDDTERLRAAIRAHLAGDSAFLTADYRVRHADGTYRWMWCRGRCHRDEHGWPRLMAGTQTDVHAMRALDIATGLPNEQTHLATIKGLIESGVPFQAAIIGVPRVAVLKEEMDTTELSGLRRAVAQRLSASLPFGVHLAYLSGDFYALVIPGRVLTAPVEDQVLAPLIAAFARPFASDRRRSWLDVAIGMSQRVEGRGRSVSDVMRDCWTSYRYARKAGKQANILDERQVEEARARLDLEGLVHRGFEQGWYQAHFQPIIELGTGKPAGAEVLCRLHHPDRGMIPPGQFIPVLEDLGLMDRLGSTMLERAIAQLEHWSRLEAPFPDLFVSVNLEARQMLQPGFVDTLRATVARTRLPPGRLKIEIVESALIGDLRRASQTVAAVRDLGIQVALDDFGTGYSSLEYLTELSFDLIKIDRAFVFGLEQDAKKQAMLDTIQAIARTLGSETCAEGIETARQAERLAATGVRYGQGFLFARPLPAADMESFIRKAHAG